MIMVPAPSKTYSFRLVGANKPIFNLFSFHSLLIRLLRPHSSGASVISDTASITVQTHFSEVNSFSNNKRL